MTKWDNITRLVGALEDEELLTVVKEFMETNPSRAEAMAVVDALQAGMEKVGSLFDSSEYFITDLVFAGEMLMEAIEVINPALTGEAEEIKGKIVLGTVVGDVHDIGKNIFANMAKVSGYEVYDIGVDVQPGAFIEKAKEVDADIVGMSGLLTVVVEGMKEVVEELKAAGMRDKVKVIIGGVSMTEDYCKRIGADGWTNSASQGVTFCNEWMK